MQKPPKVVADRAFAEAKRRWEGFIIPRRGSGLTFSHVLNDVGAESLSSLRARITTRPYVAELSNLTPASLDKLSADESACLRVRAEAALRHEVDLLGSGPISLGDVIDWHRDYKSAHRWPREVFGAITYGDPASASDVKVPWEISRLQWLIPAAQMYVLTGEDRYAGAVRSVLEQWMTENPYGASVNWTCTMEVALRVLSWTFFYHALHRSDAWADSAFQQRFLLALYEHGHFTAGHLEFSDVNGNHYTADATGLVFAGLFFGGGGQSRRWCDRGWKILETELPRQVTPDGVDFEGSVPYHRLVTELFFLPALYRERCGFSVTAAYRERVTAMARFTAAYSSSDGRTPLWGDADDARGLPFGTQPLNDHRYLLGWIGAAWDVPDLLQGFSGSRAEIVWSLGPRAAGQLPSRERAVGTLESRAFPDGGYYILRSPRDHVFIDCGPVGLGGRGGHGHNDCLSFTAILDDTPLVSDCGAFVYTASYAERDRFRSTAYHNTPQVDGEELNRFISPLHLWNVHYDARPEVRRWAPGSECAIFVGAHAGYKRLDAPVTPVRTVVLDRARSQLLVSDAFEGEGAHEISVPLHLAPGVLASDAGEGVQHLSAGNREFELHWWGEGFKLSHEEGRVSPSYGRVMSCVRLVWRRAGSVNGRLTILFRPARERWTDIQSDGTRLLRAARLDALPFRKTLARVEATTSYARRPPPTARTRAELSYPLRSSELAVSQIAKLKFVQKVCLRHDAWIVADGESPRVSTYRAVSGGDGSMSSSARAT